MNREWSIAMMVVTFCFVSITVFSQKVSTLVSKDKIVLGEQFFVKIKVDGVSEEQIKQDFQFPDTINHLEILADSVDKFGSATIVHTLTVTSFDSGYWELPSFNLQLSNNSVLSSTPLKITVLPVDVSNMQDYHDIKDILEVTPENDWLIIAIIVLLGLISLFAVLWFMNRKKAAPVQKKITASELQQLYDKAVKRLSELEASDLQNRHALMTVFTESSELSRSFIDKAHHQNTSHLTTGEYMLTQKGKLTDTESENSYFQFLRLADAVKFAKYVPPIEETRSALQILKDLITSVYQKTKAQS